MILNNIYSTKEVIIIFIKAEYLALKYNNYFIMPIHLLLSLLLTNNLCTKFLNINKNIINEKLITLLLNKYKYNINVTQITFSTKVINILTKLIKYNFKVNSLNLLLLLLTEQDSEIIYLLNYLNLNLTSLNSIITKYINTTIFPNYLTFKLNKIAINIDKINNLYKYKINNLFTNKLLYSKLLQILNLSIKKHIILKGVKGVGKFTFLQSFSNHIKLKLVPIYLYNTELWILKFNIIDLTIQEIINQIINIAKTLYNTKYKLILIIQNIELFDMINNGNNNLDNNSNKLYYLYILLNQITNYNIHIICLVDLDQYNIYIKHNKFINSYFYILKFYEISKFETFLILQNLINKYIKYYKININNYIIYELINLSKKYIPSSLLPKTPLIILEKLCSQYYLSHNKSQLFQYTYIYTNNIISINNNYITIENIKDAISDYLNISKTILFKTNTINKNNLQKLESVLYNTIYGQTHIFKNIISSIKQYTLGLKTKNKPIGSWILCGPSGTGKTELAKTLARQLFGSENELIRFDMSEYMEKHSISRLIGSPPGYIGYAEGGQLTEQVYKKPNTVILFDEIEKAHPDIYNIMLQILDEGRLTDSSGKLIDFTNTIILLTSNLGCPTNYNKYFINKNYLSNFDLKDIESNIQLNITNYFKPELLNRLTNILIFHPLNIKNLLLICNKFINELQTKLYLNKINIILNINFNIKYLLVKLSYNPLYGARPLKRLLDIIIDSSINDLLLHYHMHYFIKNKYILYYYLTQYNNLNYNIYLL